MYVGIGSVTHYVWQTDVGKASDQSLAQPRELYKQSLIPVLNLLVLLLHALQVLLHR